MTPSEVLLNNEIYNWFLTLFLIREGSFRCFLYIVKKITHVETSSNVKYNKENLIGSEI